MTPSVRSPRATFLAFTPLLVPALLLAAMGYARRWMSDDAFIYLRVTRNLVDGFGPVFNAGERVEAFTSPLWLAALWLWEAIGGSPEQGTVRLGLLCALLGLFAAQHGAARTQAETGPARTGLWIPLGAWLIATNPAFWDYATSGLESGLAFAWLGTAFWLLARDAGRSHAWVAAAVAGLGPLVRPDLAVFSAAFLVALVLGVPGNGRTRARIAARLLLAFLALPLAYQLFRMGYFAALAPNSALAKEAGMANWAQGWLYLADLLGSYRLAGPLLVLAAWWAVAVAGAARRRDRVAIAVRVAPVAAALLHALFVVRVGGDFMHARLLLPTLFGALLPLAAVRLPAGPGSARVAVGAACAAILGFGVLCATSFRADYQGGIGPHGIADERGLYAKWAGVANPIEIADYGPTHFADNARYLAEVAGALRRRDSGLPDRGVLLALDNDPSKRWLPRALHRVVPASGAVRPPVHLVAAVWNIGITGYLTGPGTHLVDRHGLSDPIASRLVLSERSRPGHEKFLRSSWYVARFVDPAALVPLDAETEAAMAALRSPGVAALLAAVTEPLSLRRFVANLANALTFHRLRLPLDPRRFVSGATAGADGRLTPSDAPANMADACRSTTHETAPDRLDDAHASPVVVSGLKRGR